VSSTKKRIIFDYRIVVDLSMVSEVDFKRNEKSKFAGKYIPLPLGVVRILTTTGSEGEP